MGTSRSDSVDEMEVQCRSRTDTFDLIYVTSSIYTYDNCSCLDLTLYTISNRTSALRL